MQDGIMTLKNANTAEIDMKIVNVISYNEPLGLHTCLNEDNQKIRIDLMTSGCLPETTNPEDLIGKTVAYEWDHVYAVFAERVEILP